MTSMARLIQTLGGRGLIRERPATYEVVIRRVREGLPFAALAAVSERYEIPSRELARILDLPPRTLARRRRERRLRPDESDRLSRIGRVGVFAEEVLGDRHKTVAWLRKPNTALGGARPLDRLDTDIGAQQVEQILGRIAHGVYS